MIGCGTAGPAAALALARAGNEVVMLEATPVLADLHPGLHGLGVHRGALFTVLRAALDEAGIEVRCGVAVRGLERAGRAWGARDAEGTAHGPFDLVALVGDAAHAMSPQLGQGVNLALLESLAGTRSGLVGAQKQKSSTTSK